MATISSFTKAIPCYSGAEGKGDVNNDGLVNDADLLTFKMDCTNATPCLVPPESTRADADGDGDVDSDDYRSILAYGQLGTPLPACTCTDSDGGQIYDVQGTTKGLSSTLTIITRTDSCFPDGVTLQEYICTASSHRVVPLAPYTCPGTCPVGTGACQAAPPSFDFSLSANSLSYTVPVGTPTQIDDPVNITLVSGTAQSVSLSAAAVPNLDITLSWPDGSSCPPPCSKILRIQTNPLAARTYTITVTGTRGSVTKQFDITINAVGPPPPSTVPSPSIAPSPSLVPSPPPADKIGSGCLAAVSFPVNLIVNYVGFDASPGPDSLVIRGPNGVRVACQTISNDSGSVTFSGVITNPPGYGNWRVDAYDNDNCPPDTNLTLPIIDSGIVTVQNTACGGGGGGVKMITECTLKYDFTNIDPACTKGAIMDKTITKFWGLCCILDTIFRLADVIFKILVALAVLIILLAAFTFLTSGGTPAQVNKAKEYIFYALLGLIVAFLSKAIASIVKLLF